MTQSGLRYVTTAPPFDGRFELNRASPQARGLVAWWPTLGSAGANTLYDFGGRGLRGTFKGVGEPAWTNDALFGSILRFDGSDDYVNVGTVLNNFNQSRTIEAMVYLNNVTQDSAIAGNFANTGSGQWLLFFDDVSAYDAKTDRITYTVSITQANTMSWIWIESTTVVAGRWYHVAVAHAWGVAASIYINGVAATSTAANQSATTVTLPTTNLYLGNVPLGKPLNGFLAWLRIYNRALSAAEVWQLYDPATRWELYAPIRRVWPKIGFQGIWAARSNQIIGPGQGIG